MKISKYTFEKSHNAKRLLRKWTKLQLIELNKEKTHMEDAPVCLPYRRELLDSDQIELSKEKPTRRVLDFAS
jgi:hypothetical protein